MSAYRLRRVLFVAVLAGCTLGSACAELGYLMKQAVEAVAPPERAGQADMGKEGRHE